MVTVKCGGQFLFASFFLSLLSYSMYLHPDFNFYSSYCFVVIVPEGVCVCECVYILS